MAAAKINIKIHHHYQHILEKNIKIKNQTTQLGHNVQKKKQKGKRENQNPGVYNIQFQFKKRLFFSSNFQRF